MEYKSTPFFIVDYQKSNIRGESLLPQIGIRFLQKKNKKTIRNAEHTVNQRIKPQSITLVKDNIKHFSLRIGKSKNHVNNHVTQL